MKCHYFINICTFVSRCRGYMYITYKYLKAHIFNQRERERERERERDKERERERERERECETKTIFVDKAYTHMHSYMSIHIYPGLSHSF